MSDYSATFPPQRPVFNADFSNSSKIDPRATFSRSDSPIDVTKAAAAAVHYWSNEKHLSSENLIPNSNANAAWQTINVTKSVSGSFLDGSDSLLVSETVASGQHYIGPNIGAGNSTSFISGTEYTATLFAKAGSVNSIQLVLTSGVFGSNAWANYDLSNAAITPVAAADASATISELGSGWMKLTLTATATATTTAAGIFVVFNNDDINSARTPLYTGSTASNVYLWEANLSSVGQKFLVETNGQIHREYAPTLKSVATAGDPRFEYDPVTNVSLGCLIESQSTNLLLASESFNDSSWTKSDTTVQLNSGVSPAGDLTADLLVESDDTVATSHYVKQSFTPASGVSYTYSFYAKAAGRTNVRIQGVFGGINGYAEVNLSTKAVSGATGSINNVTATDVGNGWVRVEATLGPTTGTGGGDVYVWLNDGSGITYTGNGYGSVLLWGAQLEQASHASSYITTLLSAKTRARDIFSMPIADTGYTGGPVTLLAESTTQTDTTNPVTLALYANGDQQIFLYGNSTNKRAAYVEADNTASTLTSTADANGVRALRVDTNDIATALNGTIDATDTSQTLPDLTGATVYIGDDSNGGNSIDGHIKRVAIYNEALSDTNLQAITS